MTNGTGGNARHAEATAGEPFVIEHEAAAIPEEHLHAVAAATDEDEEMSREGIESERVFHERAETVVTTPQIDRVGREEDLRASRESQHVFRTAATSAAT